MALKKFADTNISIDFIEQRPYDLVSINKIFESSENNEIEIIISESVITNALYITGLNAQIVKLLQIVNIICIDTETFKSAMKSGFKDKEHGYYTTAHCIKKQIILLQGTKNIFPVIALNSSRF